MQYLEADRLARECAAEAAEETNARILCIFCGLSIPLQSEHDQPTDVALCDVCGSPIPSDEPGTPPGW